jgi:hypothetical protein
MIVYRIFRQVRLCICYMHTLGVWNAEEDKPNIAFGAQIGALMHCQSLFEADGIYNEPRAVHFYRTRCL